MDPNQKNLTPVESSDAGSNQEQVKTLEPVNEGPESKGQKPPTEQKKAKDKEVSFYENGVGESAALADMQMIVEENNPADKFKPPVEPEDEPSADQNSEQPDAGKPEQQPVEEAGTIEAAGKKFTLDQLRTSHTELNKKFHQTNFKNDQEKKRAQLKILELSQKLAERDKLLENEAFKTIQRTNQGDTNNKAPAINQEKFDELVADGKTVDAVSQIVRETMTAQQKERATADKAQLVSDQKVAMANAHTENLAFMKEKFQSFSENQNKFAEWAEDLLGRDDPGLRAIDRITANQPSLKKFYATYLKDTYDFSGKIQEARHEGQSVAQMKESLQPISNPGERSPREKVAPKRLEPIDESVMAMEKHLGVGMIAAPSFFKT